ncbi:MAG: Rne/Rng family ribonuclease [Cytophagaceae bacterium]
MSNELFISSGQDGERIALINDKRLVEYHFEDQARKFNVGDIYLGVVRKVVPGLNAAFIDVGYEKDAFLHYFDLGPKVKSLTKFTKNVLNNAQAPALLKKFELEPEIKKDGKMPQVVEKGQQILVQVVKEPISSKGPRLSCELSLAGRYLVLVPFSNVVSVSKKIADKEERQRLVRLISSIRPENFGVIIRTVASGKEVAELDKDLRGLVKTWEDGIAVLKKARPKDLVIGELDRTSSILRDMLNESFDSIHVDSKEVYEEIRNYIKNIAPDKEKILKLYQGKTKMFEQTGVEKQLKTLFGKSVSLPGGGYLIIEHTEALHVIDVNSGNKSNNEGSQEETALYTNIEACREVARQLRLRDMGGIIVVDFIDMKNPDNRRVIYERMKLEMKDDRSKNVILPLSKFGLMQITRERVRPQTNLITAEVCPTCNGTGKISASLAVADQIEHKLDYIITKQNEKNIKLMVHPYLYSYFTAGLFSRRFKWFLRYYRWVKIQQDSSFGLTEFKFMNDLSQNIDMESEMEQIDIHSEEFVNEKE